LIFKWLIKFYSISRLLIQRAPDISCQRPFGITLKAAAVAPVRLAAEVLVSLHHAFRRSLLSAWRK
jgi:hypothetical protein